MDTAIEYLQKFVFEFPPLQEKFNHCLQAWEPELPPATAVFAEIGNVIADHLNEFPLEIQQETFKKIEEAMTCSDINVITAMATGLIEQLVTKSDDRVELWNQFEKLMGTASTRHAIAWRNFGS